MATRAAMLTARTYRHLFLAQIVALVGTGLATVALGLLAHQPYFTERECLALVV